MPINYGFYELKKFQAIFQNFKIIYINGGSYMKLIFLKMNIFGFN